MRYFITSAPALGFDQVWRAGLPWPKKGIEVEVVDQAEDPKQVEGGPRLIGKKTWEALKSDGRIYARPAGDLEEMATASVALVEAKQKIAALETEVADLKAKLAGGEAKTAQEPPPPKSKATK